MSEPLRDYMGRVLPTVGTEVATDTEVAEARATYGLPDVVAQPATHIAATDRAMLFEAIADTPAGGHLLIPGRADSPYALDQSLVVNKGMTISGLGCDEVWGGVADVATAWLPAQAPYLRGTVIDVVAPGVDAVQISASGTAVNLHNFGIRFDDAIKFANTGHGVVSTPPARLTYLDHGLFSPAFSGVKVYGHDGNHYAFSLINTLGGLFEHLRSFGGGGMRVRNQSGAYNYGNLTAEECYHALVAAGTAHGLSLEADSAFASNWLNLMTFIRPQVWVANASLAGVTAPAAASQRIVHSDTNVRRVTWVGPDFESNVSASTRLPIEGCSVVNPVQLGAQHADNATGPPTGSITTGTVYRNTRGTAVQVSMAWTLNPTGAADATVNVTTGPTSALNTGTAQPARCRVPAAGPTGIQQNLTWLVAPGYYMKVDFANAVRDWTTVERVTA